MAIIKSRADDRVTCWSSSMWEWGTRFTPQHHIIKAHTESDYNDCNRMVRCSLTHSRMAWHVMHALWWRTPALSLTRGCQGCLVIIISSPQRKRGDDNKPFPFKQITWMRIYANHFCSKPVSKTWVVWHLWLQKRLGNRLRAGNHVHRWLQSPRD